MIDKKYNHLKVEENKYDYWKEQGFFKSGDQTKVPFCIVIPPPNVTGKLHLGHAWDTTLQDIIIRFKRMQGYDALWLPGMDHAGIATQAKIDAKLRAEGIKPRDMDREDWLKQAWSWKEEYAESIRSQWAKLGLSLDYSKERFTLDEGLSNAVSEVFIKLYEKGLIYRGERIINWDPKAMTALSNEEVIHKEIEGALYYLKYMLEGTDEYLEVATTRPETIFGDSAVAVNPKDERYNKLIGKNAIVPIIGRKVPIIGDEHADMEFGTGALKITPAHDPNDFEIGNRHNLERIICMNGDGTMNSVARKYDGMDRFECRKKLVKDAEVEGVLLKIETHTHSVGHSERTDAIVEPYLSKQWFVKMRPLADRVLDNQKNKDKKVNFVPTRFEKIMNHWMEITYDWCISRQLWWGHQIPAWYRGEEVYVGKEAPIGEGWNRDDDVLDTWFSSALWPFSTLGWPNSTDLLERYYPNNVLVTGYDIIPFWVNRMTFQGLEFTGERPFKDCLIHGLIRDEQGRKMSKSLGNGIDPMEVIDQYGADSLRYFLTTTAAPGQDLRFSEEKIVSIWNFINKIWNASRFVMMKMEEQKPSDIDLDNLSLADKWILHKLDETITDVTKNMDKYEFGEVDRALYSFVWNDFCDWYIETSKLNLNTSVLFYVLKAILKMLHPFMPYVTDEIYTKITGEETIMLASWPAPQKQFKLVITKKDASNMEKVREMIKELRNIRSEYDIPNKNKIILTYDTDSNEIKDLINNTKEYFYKFASVEEAGIYAKGDFDYEGYTSYTVTLPDVVLQILTTKEAVDIKQEITRLETEKEKLINEVNRCQKMLANENFIAKAPAAKINEEKEKLGGYEDQLDKVIKQLENLK